MNMKKQSIYCIWVSMWLADVI